MLDCSAIGRLCVELSMLTTDGSDDITTSSGVSDIIAISQDIGGGVGDGISGNFVKESFVLSKQEVMTTVHVLVAENEESDCCTHCFECSVKMYKKFFLLICCLIYQSIICFILKL